MDKDARLKMWFHRFDAVNSGSPGDRDDLVLLDTVEERIKAAPFA